eukprot:1457717-Prymnesium_polylepis.1
MLRISMRKSRVPATWPSSWHDTKPFKLSVLGFSFVGSRTGVGEYSDGGWVAGQSGHGGCARTCGRDRGRVASLHGCRHTAYHIPAGRAVDQVSAWGRA